MTNKALILFGSAKENGNTAYLVNLFKQNFNGKIEEINLFESAKAGRLSPCIDCNYCKQSVGCVIQDDFSKIISDDYNIILLASPIYMSNLTAPFFNIISRFNFEFCNKKHLNKTILQKEKIAVLILAGGGEKSPMIAGKSNEDLPIRQAKYIFKKLNASLNSENIVLSLNTNDLPSCLDESNKIKITEIAKKLNEF
jgi:multimeric flavodoxin WrbA